MHFALSILLSVVLSAQLDSTEMSIGNQTCLHISAVTSGVEQVVFPRYDVQIQKDIEVVEQGSVDTIRQDDGRVCYKQDITITSFKDTLIYIKPLTLVVDGDTQLTNPLSLNVIQPFVMDSTDAITDIKGVLKPRTNWKDIFLWAGIGLLVIGLALGLYYLIYWIQSRLKKEETEAIDPELLRPCDEVALEKLDKIKAEKAWQNGDQKKYYSELTFVIREYIGRRYDIHSTEKTSDDTLIAMKPILLESDQRELYTKLEQMLRLADLVKFAKWNALPNENETALIAAYNFVKSTRQVIAPENEETKSTNNQ